MELHLSQQSEQYLEQLVSGGLYPSTVAALEAAVAALREKKDEQVPLVCEEHRAAVEQGLASAEAGLARPMLPADWARLRQIAHDVASGNKSTNA
ncbi:MAG TPA: hypothetical protein VIK18_24835 [Pirellulales bacterium]